MPMVKPWRPSGASRLAMPASAGAISAVLSAIGASTANEKPMEGAL